MTDTRRPVHNGRMVWWRLLADSVVVFHAAYVAFVVFGFAAILAGTALGWRWVRNYNFRAAHMAAILLVCVEAFAGVTCPLTTLESYLRVKGGGAGYPGDFIGYWAHRMIFYDAPPWMFTALYVAFAALVGIMFWLRPPRRTAPKRAADTRLPG
jgi:hypothetical protein